MQATKEKRYFTPLDSDPDAICDWSLMVRPNNARVVEEALRSSTVPYNIRYHTESYIFYTVPKASTEKMKKLYDQTPTIIECESLDFPVYAAND